MKKIIVGSLLATSLLLANNSVKVNINNDTLEVGADIYLNKIYDVSNNSNYYLTMSHLRMEDNQDDTNSISSVGFKVVNPLTNDSGVSFGLGMKSVYTNQMDKTFMAFPLTVNGRVEVNEMIYIDADVSYSPRVLSFSDADSYTDMKLRVNYKVLADGYVFVGARRIDTKYENIDETKFDSSAFFGFEVRF